MTSPYSHHDVEEIVGYIPLAHRYSDEISERAWVLARRRMAVRHAEPVQSEQPETAGDFWKALAVAVMLVAAGVAFIVAAVGYFPVVQP